MMAYVIKFDRWSNPKREDLSGYNAWDYLSGSPGEFETKTEARRWLRSHSKGKDSYGVKAIFKVVQQRGNPHRLKTRKRATSRRKKNPVRVAASMAGKSTGWIPAKAVRVVRGKGGKVRVDVKR